jgi:hypothetical protein
MRRNQRTNLLQCAKAVHLETPKAVRMVYPKINTLWKRDETTHAIIEGDYSRPEFDAINWWHITEKVDGTNIRVVCGRYTGFSPHFFGKTDNAEIPTKLLEHLKQTFTGELLTKQLPEARRVVLYGEGYGGNIQSGKKYRDTPSFVLFDAWIDGWWLEPEKVKILANQLSISYVPELGVMTKEDAIFFAKHGLKSEISQCANAEGIVARSHPLMLFRDGNPVMWKLKAKDYD